MILSGLSTIAYERDFHCGWEHAKHGDPVMDREPQAMRDGRAAFTYAESIGCDVRWSKRPGERSAGKYIKAPMAPAPAATQETSMASFHQIIIESACKVLSRYDIREPWHWSGFIYATDGAIIVRQPHEGADGKGSYPPVDSLPWDAGKYKPEPHEVPEPKLVRCINARFTFDGSCAPSCTECSGTQQALGPVDINGFAISSSYATLLRKHSARVFVPIEAKPTNPVRFTIDNVEGLLMQVRT